MNSCLTTGEEQLQRRMQSGESFLHSQSLIKRADPATSAQWHPKNSGNGASTSTALLELYGQAQWTRPYAEHVSKLRADGPRSGRWFAYLLSRLRFCHLATCVSTLWCNEASPTQAFPSRAPASSCALRCHAPRRTISSCRSWHHQYARSHHDSPRTYEQWVSNLAWWLGLDLASAQR